MLMANSLENKISNLFSIFSDKVSLRRQEIVRLYEFDTNVKD